MNTKNSRISIRLLEREYDDIVKLYRRDGRGLSFSRYIVNLVDENEPNPDMMFTSTKDISIYVGERKYQEFMERAEHLNVSASSFVREVLLNKIHTHHKKST